MPINAVCPDCTARIKAPENLAGRTVKCPRCGSPMNLPAASVTVTRPLPATTPIEATTPSAPPADLGETVDAVHSPPTGTLGGQRALTPTGDQYDFLGPPQAADELGRLGPFRVLKVLGAGGMGIVFLGEDPQLQRRVALKVMRPALAASANDRKRFLREARTAAAVSHDHIVGILLVGEERGVPYLAMPFLEGETLEDRLRLTSKLPLPELLRIGREVAEGLDAAGGKGLIHRDVKPANIWLEARPGGKSGVPRAKLLDFGLARVAGDDAGLTQSGAITGTPLYMAPEQARGEPVDCRADLFSLGCVLYRMATGELPFKGSNSMAVLSALAFVTPPPVRELDPSLPAALEELITQLLCKNPAGRPPAARDVADALARIESGACPHPAAPPPLPPPLARRPKKAAFSAEAFFRHHRLAVGVGGLTFFLLIALAVASLALWQKTGPASKSDLASGPPLGRLDPARIPIQERFDWQPRELVAVLGDHRDGSIGYTRSLAVSPDGHRVLAGGKEMLVRMWDLKTGEKQTFRGHTADIMGLAFFRDNRRILSSSYDGTVRIWDMETGKELQRRQSTSPAGAAVALLPDGRRLVAAEGKAVILWELEKGVELKRMTSHTAPITFLVTSPDGTLAVSNSLDKTTRLWDLRSGILVRTYTGFTGNTLGAAFSPDGKSFAIGAADTSVRLWGIDSDKELRRFQGHSKQVTGVTFTPDGHRLATAGHDGRIIVWNVENGTRAWECKLPGTVERIAFGPDGKHLVASYLGTVYVLRLELP